MRESGPELAAAFSEGVRREGVDVVHLGLASTDMIYFAAGKLDAPGAMLTASHNPAAYNGIKLCLAGARPVGVESGLDEIKADGRSAADRRRHAARTWRRVDGRPARRVRRPCALVRRCERAASDEGRGRHRERHGRPDRPPGVRQAAVRARGALPRARRHVPEPPRRPDPAREPDATSQAVSRSSAPTSAWRSTATPTACSSSTSRAGDCRARPPPRCSRWASSRSTLVRRSSTT